MRERSIGIDVSKDRLEACRHGDGTRASFPNDAAGMRRLLGWLGRDGCVVFEPTGRYHLELEQCLTEAGLPFVKVNPRQARRFAESLGVQAKTDRADAAMLARMGAALELPPSRPRDQAHHDLAEFIAARRALIKDRTAAKNRAKTLRLALLRRQNAARLRRIESDLDAIDREIAARIAADEELAERRQILTSIPGISEITAAAIITLVPELGTLGRAQAAKLAGLAPIARQSGRWRGQAFIRGGRAALREALYMPALAAMRCNPDLNAFAGRLKAAGKPAKVTITATMRKLLLLANALVRDQRAWEPKTA